RESPGRLGPDGADLGVMQLAGVAAALEEEVEEDGDRVGGREDHQPRLRQRRDSIPDLLAGRQRPYLDRGYLDGPRPQLGQLAAKRLHLVAGAGDQDRAPVEGPARERVQAVGQLDAGSDYEQGVALEPARGGDSRQLRQPA